MSVIVILAGLFAPNGTICIICLGVGIFVLIYFISKPLLKSDEIYIIVRFFSDISFPFFLIHHMVIENNSTIYEKNQLVAYVFVLTITIVYAWCLLQAATGLTKN